MSRTAGPPLLVALLVAVAPSLAPAADEPPTQGLDALCARIAAAGAPSLEGARAVALELVAEGAMLDLAGAAEGLCSKAILTNGPGRVPVDQADRVVRLRLRARAGLLLAFVEIRRPVEGGHELLFADGIEVPAGDALGNWLAAGGRGIESWLAGAVDGHVLALCGLDGAKGPEVALVLAARVEFHRWDEDALTPIGRSPLPPAVRPHARIPSISAVCDTSPEGLRVTFAVPDRARVASAVLHVDGKIVVAEPESWSWATRGLEPLAGTGLMRGAAGLFGAVAFGPEHDGRPLLVGATQDGTLHVGDAPASPRATGLGLAVLDLDGDRRLDLVRTRPVLPEADPTDRLVLSPLDDPRVVKLESQPVRGLLGAVGAVPSVRAPRVLAVRFDGSRSALHAFGVRRPEAE